MKNKLLLVAGVALALVAVVGVRAGQRIRVIDVDGAATPVTSSVTLPALTAPTTGTITPSLQSAAASTKIALTQATKTATNQFSFTLQTATITVSITPQTVNVTNVGGTVSAVWTGATASVSGVATGATQTAAYGFGSATDQLLQTSTVNDAYAFANDTSVVLTNVSATGSAYGFTLTQASKILSNSAALYNLLQSY